MVWGGGELKPLSYTPHCSDLIWVPCMWDWRGICSSHLTVGKAEGSRSNLEPSMKILVLSRSVGPSISVFTEFWIATPSTVEKSNRDFMKSYMPMQIFCYHSNSCGTIDEPFLPVCCWHCSKSTGFYIFASLLLSAVWQLFTGSKYNLTSCPFRIFPLHA